MVLTDKNGNTITLQGWENQKSPEAKDYEKDHSQVIIFDEDKYILDFINDLANNVSNGFAAEDVINVDGFRAVISATVGDDTYSLPKDGELVQCISVGGREGNKVIYAESGNDIVKVFDAENVIVDCGVGNDIGT